MYYSFLIYSFTDGHLGCIQHVAIVNNASMNIGVHKSFALVIQDSSRIFPAAKTLGQKAVAFLDF